ncbi:1941_t:CDS:1, partial [Scutellospora calospora]
MNELLNKESEENNKGEGKENVEVEENNESKSEVVFSRSESDFDDELSAENVTDNEILDIDLIDIDE